MAIPWSALEITIKVNVLKQNLHTVKIAVLGAWFVSTDVCSSVTITTIKKKNLSLISLIPCPLPISELFIVCPLFPTEARGNRRLNFCPCSFAFFRATYVVLSSVRFLSLTLLCLSTFKNAYCF